MSGSEQDRLYLSNRRLNHSAATAWNGIRLWVTVGFDQNGVGREVFAAGRSGIDESEGVVPSLRAGSDAEAVLADANILISMLLQHGYRLDELLSKLMRADVAVAAARFADENTGVRKPSMIAAVLAAAIEIELEEGDAIARFYALARSGT